MTRPRQTVRELELVRAFLAARGARVTGTRAGEAGPEPDVIATLEGGEEVGVEVVEIRDEGVAEKDDFLPTESDRLQDMLRAQAAQDGVDVSSLHVGVWFEDRVPQRQRDRIVDEVLNYVRESGVPTSLVELPSRLPGVRALELRAIAGLEGALVWVSGPLAFACPLPQLVSQKAKKSYARGKGAVLLAVIPTDQRWGLGAPVQVALARLQDLLTSDPPPFSEVVVFDELTGDVVFSWPSVDPALRS